MAKENQAGEKMAGKDNLAGMIQKRVESIQEKMRQYNEKYVASSIEKGKETVKEYSDKYVAPVIEKGKTYVDKPYKKISGNVDELVAKGRSIEKDARKKIDGYFENGRKYIVKLPMVETLEKRVNAGFNRVPALVNLPGRTDIEKLNKAMESLNANLESLNKQTLA